MYSNGSAIYNLPRIRTYAEADQFFKQTKPLRSRKYDAESVRPLHPKRGGSYMAYRVEHKVKYGRDVYDLMLYSTPVIRYFKPEADGSYFVSIRGYRTITTHKYLDRHGWGYGSKRFDTTNNTSVFVPYATALGDGLKASAVLRFNRQGLLDVPNSWHTPFYKTFVSDDDKNRRVMFKAKIDALLDYLAVSRQTIQDMASREGAWRYIDYRVASVAVDIRKFVESENPDDFVPQETLERMLSMAAYKMYNQARKRARTEYWWQTRRIQSEATFNSIDLNPIITGIRDDIMDSAGYMTKTRKEILPMFATEYKGKYYVSRDYDELKYTEQTLILRPLV
jgi:hypothetical protein